LCLLTPFQLYDATDTKKWPDEVDTSGLQKPLEDTMKKDRHLAYEDRCQIHALLKRGYSHAEIAWDIAVHRTTIWRELRRNSGTTGYYYHWAESQAEERQRSRRSFPRKMKPRLVAFIETKLEQGWSPQQISGWLKYRQSELPTISHERIYQHVWRNRREGGTLYLYLRHRGKKYRRCGSRYSGVGRIPNRVDIDQRPAIVERKIRLGDWELDTIIGAKRRGALVSMVERRSKLVRLAWVPSCKSETVAHAIETSLAEHKNKVHTLTMDNGLEFAKHVAFGKSLQADTFFARPYSAWERGLNEHTNGLVRQYFPKSTDFTTVSADHVRNVEELLNSRPRAVLGFRTPLEVFDNPQASLVLLQ
jgi:transposase, IS30 family